SGPAPALTRRTGGDMLLVISAPQRVHSIRAAFLSESSGRGTAYPAGSFSTRRLGRRTRVPVLVLRVPVLAACRSSPRGVALVRQAPLGGLLALGRVGDSVVMVRVIGQAPARLDGFLRRMGRNQAIAAQADEVPPPRLHERLAHGEP